MKGLQHGSCLCPPEEAAPSHKALGHPGSGGACTLSARTLNPEATRSRSRTGAGPGCPSHLLRGPGRTYPGSRNAGPDVARGSAGRGGRRDSARIRGSPRRDPQSAASPRRPPARGRSPAGRPLRTIPGRRCPESPRQERGALLSGSPARLPSAPVPAGRPGPSRRCRLGAQHHRPRRRLPCAARARPRDAGGRGRGRAMPAPRARSLTRSQRPARNAAASLPAFFFNVCGTGSQWQPRLQALRPLIGAGAGSGAHLLWSSGSGLLGSGAVGGAERSGAQRTCSAGAGGGAAAAKHLALPSWGARGSLLLSCLVLSFGG